MSRITASSESHHSKLRVPPTPLTDRGWRFSSSSGKCSPERETSVLFPQPAGPTSMYQGSTESAACPRRPMREDFKAPSAASSSDFMFSISACLPGTDFSMSRSAWRLMVFSISSAALACCRRRIRITITTTSASVSTSSSASISETPRMLVMMSVVAVTATPPAPQRNGGRR